jgi:antitoxin component YwqK of YwqJK toxin-antitoxin module
MMIRINKYFFIVLILSQLSCRNTDSKHFHDEGNSVTSKLNDSLKIDIFFEDKSPSMIFLKNTKSEVVYIYSFHADGLTPSCISKEVKNKKEGLFYTYFSSGHLNNKMYYEKGQLDGIRISYDQPCNIIYKANYINGEIDTVYCDDRIQEVEIDLYEGDEKGNPSKKLAE